MPGEAEVPGEEAISSSRRRVIVLSVVALLILGVYGVLLAGLLRGQPPASPGVAALPPTPSLSAKEKYAQAEAAARAWRSDVRLMEASAAWSMPTEVQLLSGQAAWAFRFYSPSAGQVYEVVVSESAVEGTAGSMMGAPGITVDPAAWQVDSPLALVRFLDHGGREFLAGHHVTTVRLQLSATLLPGRLVWLITALSSTERTAMGVLVDAFTGEVQEASAP